MTDARPQRDLGHLPEPISPRFRPAMVVLSKGETKHGTDVLEIYQAGLPKGHDVFAYRYFVVEFKFVFYARLEATASFRRRRTSVQFHTKIHCVWARRHSDSLLQR